MVLDVEQYQKKIMVVYSPGGGNGKSEIAANLSFLLAKKGLRTWVLDSNTFAPAQDLIFGLPVTDQTFSEFLTDTRLSDIPTYDLAGVHKGFQGTRIALTPSRRTDPDVRFRVHEAQNYGGTIAEKIPRAVFHEIEAKGVDLLIVDTHPGFEQINEVWMALTGVILIISRLNDIDLDNLAALLHDGEIADVGHKLVVFNNVQLDENRQASEAMDNTGVVDRMVNLRRREDFRAYFSDCEDTSCMQEGMTEIYHRPFLYSEKMARFGNGNPRDGLFVQKEPDDPFSRELRHLADHILKQHRLLNPGSTGT
jgi:Mrp family chromosome partitioning ATPase